MFAHECLSLEVISGGAGVVTGSRAVVGATELASGGDGVELKGVALMPIQWGRTQPQSLEMWWRLLNLLA